MVDIRRRLAALNPAAFSLDLGQSLFNLAHCFDEAGDRAGAIEAMAESIACIEGIARRFPDSEAGRWLPIMQDKLRQWQAEPDPSAG